MTNQAPQLPLSAEQLTQLQSATQDFSVTQLAWLSGYFWGRISGDTPGTAAASLTANAPQAAVPAPTVTLLSASQTGNARRLAEQVRDDLLAHDIAVNLINAGDYKFKQIAQEKWLVVVTSTQGEGEPPEEAVALHKYLMSKKAPKLNETAFAVFGLGDSSYEFFCQAGKDFDQRLADLGAERLLDRGDADVDYQAAADAWREQVVATLKQRLPASSASQVSQAAAGASDEIDSTPYTKEQPLVATLSVSQKITGDDSQKDIRHLEIDLGESGLRYTPGDALGIWFDNDPALVQELLDLLVLEGSQSISLNGETLPLAQALQKHFELTVNTAQIVEKYAHLSANSELLALVGDKASLQAYAQQWPIVDMVRHAPAELSAEQLTELLRPLTPRLYSIASSQAETADEVHITVGAVRYDIEGRERTGGASGFLADRLAEDEEVRVFIEHNDNFRLPANPQAPVIMIGPGTGIAPFRAFIQQRDNDGAEGKNWLFFGNPHFTEDFLYQVEWQKYVKDGVLTNIDLAWSRDQQEKSMCRISCGRKGLKSGAGSKMAPICMCGDATRMARDVEQALIDIIAEHGQMDPESADEYLSELRVARRYQRDVY